MRAGQLRTLVTIEESSPSYNALNESISGWSTRVTRPAHVMATGGREFVAAKQMIAELTDLVEIRYTPGILAQMRIRIGARLLDIRAVVDVEEKHRTHRLFCVEREVSSVVTDFVAVTVVVSPSTPSILTSATQQFTAVVRNAAGQIIPGAAVTWSSLTPATATINSSSGLATALLAAGTTVIRATSGAVYGDANLTVVFDTAVATVVVSPASPTVANPGTQQFTAVAKNAAGSTIPGATFTWQSLNTGFATVDSSGLATTVAPGVATIRATSSGVNGDATMTVSGVSTYLSHTFPTNSTTVPGTADTGQVAIVLLGTWGVQTQRLYVVSSAGADIVVWDAAHADGTVSCDVAALDSPAAAIWRLVFRCTDVNNFFQMIALSATQWALYKTVANVSTQIGLWTAVAPAAGQNVVAVLNGSSITMKIGSTTLGTVTETFNQTATKIGALNGGGLSVARWDNLLMTS